MRDFAISARFQRKHVDNGLTLASQDIYDDLPLDSLVSCDDDMTDVMCTCREVASRLEYLVPCCFGICCQDQQLEDRHAEFLR